MVFKMFIPYQANDSQSCDMEEYYKGEGDYIEALRKEEEENGSLVFNAMASNTLSSNNIFGMSRGHEAVPEIKIDYTKSECTLYSPDGAIPETVDSMIDKFVSQNEFLVTVQFNISTMEGEFEEELSSWERETSNILSYAKEMGEKWIDKNIPRRDLRLSFINKSGNEVTFQLEGSEIEEKLSKRRYIFYVRKMQLVK